MATLMIDNYDSFTYNIYQYLEQLGAHVIVHRNDKITIEECIKLNPRNIVISPGPGHPNTSSGISKQVLKTFAGKVPILGVCLGEQCMYTTYGGTVSYTGEIVHGKTSSITHDGHGLYRDVPQGIQVTRYHSLSGDPDTLPDCLEITSWTNSRKVMGIRHKKYVMEGVQFHPESIASEAGYRMIANFLKWEGGTWDNLRYREDLINPVFDVLGYGNQNGVTQGQNDNLLKKSDGIDVDVNIKKDKDNENNSNDKKNIKATINVNNNIKPTSVPLLPSTDSIGNLTNKALLNNNLSNAAATTLKKPTTTASTTNATSSDTTNETKIISKQINTEHLTSSYYPLTYSMSSLEHIFEQRRVDIAKEKSKPGRSPYHLSKTIEQGFLPTVISVVDLLRKNPYNKNPCTLTNNESIQNMIQSKSSSSSDSHHHNHHNHHNHHHHNENQSQAQTQDQDKTKEEDTIDLAIIGEIKRASPSQGNIDINMHAISEALKLVSAGITCISVITEPRWFKGSVNDLRDIRLAINSIPNRPALIQNDFVMDKYQIMEARINGADAITLYASMLSKEELKSMIEFSHSISLDVLVIVFNEDEMRFALSLGVQLIGVNNRDYHTFNIDPTNTTALAKFVPNNVILVALSGIKSHEDALFYHKNGAKAILVGESLIKAKDKKSFVKNLLISHPQKKKRIN